MKSIARVGNCNRIVFDSTLMGLARLKRGGHLNVELHDGGVITLTPVRQNIDPKKAAATPARLTRKNSELFRRLA